MLVYQQALVATVPMAKPSVIRAEQPLAPDLAIDRAITRSASSSRRRDLVFVINPRGANGRAGEQWKKLLPHLRSSLGSECNICESLTSGPCHAIDITREAIREGADAVVAVGGDGTLHEVHAHPLLKNNNLVLSLQASNFDTLLMLKGKRQMCSQAISFPYVHQNVH